MPKITSEQIYDAAIKDATAPTISTTYVFKSKSYTFDELKAHLEENFEYADYILFDAKDQEVVDKALSIAPSRFNTPIRERLDFAEAKQNITRMFGAGFSDRNVTLVTGLIQEHGYGAFTQDGRILLSNLSEKGTEYHEAFHRVWRRFLTPVERAAAITEFEKRSDKEQKLNEIRKAGYTGNREYLIEEILAEEFKIYSQKYTLKDGKLTPKNFIERLFDELMQLLKAIIGRPIQKELYDNILNGKYYDAKENEAYENMPYVLSRDIEFKMTASPIMKVSTAVALTVNSAITIDMFNSELQAGKLYDILDGKADFTESYTNSVFKQLSRSIDHSVKELSNNNKTAVRRAYLPIVSSILSSDNYSPYFKLYTTNSEALINILKHTKMLEDLLGSMNRNALAQEDIDIIDAATMANADMEDIRAALGIYFIKEELKDGDPAIDLILRSLSEDAYPNDYASYLSAKPGLNPQTLALTNLLSAITNELLYLKVASEISVQMVDKTSSELVEHTYNSVYGKEHTNSFFNLWKKSVYNVGGKINAALVSEEVEMDDMDEESTKETRNASFDQVAFEIDPKSSAPTAIKLLIAASPKVDIDGNWQLNEFGLPEAVSFDSVINKLINTLGNIPQFAMWHEFTKFTAVNNELSTVLSAIDAMPTNTQQEIANKENIKVKLLKSFNNHLYDFNVSVVEKGNIFLMNANSNNSVRALRESWKSAYASEYNADNRKELISILSAIQEGKKPLANWVAQSYPVVIEGVDQFDKYLSILGIELSAQSLAAMKSSPKRWGEEIYKIFTHTLTGARGNISRKIEDIAISPTTLANSLFAYGSSADSSYVGSSIDKIASLEAANLKDKSQSLMSNGKMYFAASLNSNLTHVTDTLNYIVNLDNVTLGMFIAKELSNPNNVYHKRESDLDLHVEEWYNDKSDTSKGNAAATVKNRIKLLMLTMPHLFSAYNRGSYYMERAIHYGENVQIGVFESVKNSINGDSKSISKLSKIETKVHLANSTLSGHVRVMQHADRSTTYSLNNTLSEAECDTRIFDKLHIINRDILLKLKTLSENANVKDLYDYAIVNTKYFDKASGGLHPEIYGIAAEFMQYIFEAKAKLTLPKGTPNLADAYFKTFAKFARTFETMDEDELLSYFKEYVSKQKNLFIADYSRAGLLAADMVWEGKNKMYKSRYLATNVESYADERSVAAAAAASLKLVWSRNILTHMEETVLFTGNVTTYGSPSKMFKRLNTQSSTGTLSNTDEEFLKSIRNLNQEAQNGLGNLAALPYTDPNSTKNLSLIVEVVGTEEEFSSESYDSMQQSVYRTVYKIGRLQGLTHAQAHAKANRKSKEVVAGYKNKVNENDGISFINIFAYRQYMKSVDNWSKEQEKFFKYEMIVLADIIATKTKVEKLLAEGKTPTARDYAYSSDVLLAYRLVSGNPNATIRDYHEDIENNAAMVNDWIMSRKEGLSVLKPQYTGPVWMSEEHMKTDPMLRDTTIGVRKTAYDPLLPSMLRGASYNERRKLLDSMIGMHAQGIDITHMQSAAKTGHKKPVKLFAGNNMENINPQLFEKGNTSILEWKYMKDQQFIDSEQKTEIKDSVQARKNILSNTKHMGVPIDFDMQKDDGEYYTQREWVGKWNSLTQEERLASSKLYSLEERLLDLQHEILIKKANELAHALKYSLKDTSYVKLPFETVSGITGIVELLLKESNRRDMPDNVLTAIKSLRTGGYIDVLPNSARIEPLLMSLVTNNLLSIKRPGNLVPQLSITGMDKVGTARLKQGVTRELNTYTIDEYEEKSTKPAEIIISLPKAYYRSVLNKYRTATGNKNLTLFEAVKMLNTDMNTIDPATGRPKAVVEVFALRIPNQQLSSNDVFTVKEFYIGSKENFVYVPAETVVKAGSDFDIDKINLYWESMDGTFEPIEYVQGSKSVRKFSDPNNRTSTSASFAQTVQELSTLEAKIAELKAAVAGGNDERLMELLQLLEEKGEVTREDCGGTAENGIVTPGVTLGGKWSVVKAFKGASHAEGGIDITVGPDGVKMANNGSKQPFKAAAGVVIPKATTTNNNTKKPPKRLPYYNPAQMSPIGDEKPSEEVSKYKPSRATNPNAVYYGLPQVNKVVFDYRNINTLINNAKQKKDVMFNNGSTARSEYGKDEKGEYISYYKKEGNRFTDLLGTSKEYYERKYIDRSAFKYEQADDMYNMANIHYKEQERDVLRDGALPLTQGKYYKKELPINMLEELRTISKEEGVDVYDMLSVVGKENGFGNILDKNKLTSNSRTINGESLANKYRAKSITEYLLDKKSPLVEKIKTGNTWSVFAVDPNAFAKHLTDHPEVVQQYGEYLKTVKRPDYGEYNSYKELARMIKNKEMHKYNPGDPDYQNKLAQEKALLKKEKGIADYLKKPAYLYQVNTRPQQKK